MKSTQFEPGELADLRAHLKKHGIKEIERKSEHEAYRFEDKKKGILVIGYKTGKVVYKEGDFLKELIERSVAKNEGFDYFLGADESGKGEWYGPLVVACVALKQEDIPKLKHMGVMDSKQIPLDGLMRIGEKLVKSNVKRKVLVLSPDEYNMRYAELKKEGKTLNDLLAKSHAAQIKELLGELEYEKARVVIDMFDYKKTEKELRDVDGEKHVIIQKSRAESETPVAAASIIAKYLFEKDVDRLEKEQGIRIRGTRPPSIPKDILPHVAKMHFRNVSAAG